jgi:hypothetical protein
VLFVVAEMTKRIVAGTFDAGAIAGGEARRGAGGK